MFVFYVSNFQMSFYFYFTQLCLLLLVLFISMYFCPSFPRSFLFVIPSFFIDLFLFLSMFVVYFYMCLHLPLFHISIFTYTVLHLLHLPLQSFITFIYSTWTYDRLNVLTCTLFSIYFPLLPPSPFSHLTTIISPYFSFILHLLNFTFAFLSSSLPSITPHFPSHTCYFFFLLLLIPYLYFTNAFLNLICFPPLPMILISYLTSPPLLSRCSLALFEQFIFFISSITPYISHHHCLVLLSLVWVSRAVRPTRAPRRKKCRSLVPFLPVWWLR